MQSHYASKKSFLDIKLYVVTSIVEKIFAIA
jgi:hypothetical protein